MRFDVLIFDSNNDLINIYLNVDFSQLSDIALICVPINGHLEAFNCDWYKGALLGSAFNKAFELAFANYFALLPVKYLALLL